MLTLEKQEVLYNPVTGDKLFIMKNAQSTAGEFLEIEAIYQPAKDFAPEHFHPTQEEHFTVRSGKLMTRINGIVREYTAGESFVVPARIPHGMYNAGTEAVHFSWKIYPALRTEDFFRSIYQLPILGKVNKKGQPALSDTLVLLKEFQQEIVFTKIPLFLQQFIFKFILPLLGSRNRNV